MIITSFYKYGDIKKIDNLSLESNYSFLANFLNDLKMNFLNILIETNFDEYYDLSDAKRSKIDPKYDPANLRLDEYNYSKWCNEKSGDEEELDDLPPIEGGEKAKEGKRLKILTPNKLV